MLEYYITLAVVLIAVYGTYLMAMRAMCYAKTADMGFDTRWGILNGCRIEVDDGQWIPLDSYYYRED